MPPLDLKSLVTDARASAGLVPAPGLGACFELDARDADETELVPLARRAIAADAAGFCLSAAAVPALRRALGDAALPLIVGLNMPEGGDDIAAVATAAGAAVADGAAEIDILAPLLAIEEGDIGLVGDLVEACRATMGAAVPLKLALPANLAQDPSVVTGAARTAVMAGADFLALFDAGSSVEVAFDLAALLLSVIAEADGKVGFKANAVEDETTAAVYANLATAILKPEWIVPRHFRLATRALMAGERRA